MKNLFKINGSSDNITPLSPNPPPPLGSKTDLRLEKKLTFSPKFSNKPNNETYPSVKALNHGPGSNQTSVQHISSQVPQYQQLPPINFSALPKPKTGKGKEDSAHIESKYLHPAHYHTYYSHSHNIHTNHDDHHNQPTQIMQMNLNMSTQTISAKSHMVSEAEVPVRALSDSSVMIETNTNMNPNQTANPTIIFNKMPNKEKHVPMSPTKSLSEIAHNIVPKKLRKTKTHSHSKSVVSSPSMVMTSFTNFKPQSATESEFPKSSFDLKHQEPETKEYLSKLDLLSPISPLSPFVLNSPKNSTKITSNPTNDSISSNVSTIPASNNNYQNSNLFITSTNPTSMHKSKSASPFSSPLSTNIEFFDHYVVEPASDGVKQDSINSQRDFNNQYSFPGSNWTSVSSLGDSNTKTSFGLPSLPSTSNHRFGSSDSPCSQSSDIMDPAPSLSSSVSTQSLYNRSPNFNDNADFMSNNTIYQEPLSVAATTATLTHKPKNLSPDSGYLKSLGGHNHMDSNASTVSLNSEKFSVLTHGTRSSSISSALTESSRRSSKGTSLQSNLINSDIIVGSTKKVEEDPENHLKMQKLFETSDVPSTLPDAAVAALKKGSHCKDKSFPNQTHNDPEIVSDLKDMDQKGLMISASGLPSISHSNLPPLPSSAESWSNDTSRRTSSNNSKSNNSSPRTSDPTNFTYNSKHSNSSASVSSSGTSRKNSKSSVRSNDLTKDLPELPPEARSGCGRLGSTSSTTYKSKFSTPSSRREHLKDGLTSRQTSIYDWECISNNLNLINMSIGKWDQQENKKKSDGGRSVQESLESQTEIDFELGSGVGDIPSYYFQSHGAGAAQGSSSAIINTVTVKNRKDAPNLARIQAPKAIDMSNMERTTPVSATFKPASRGYDLTGKYRHRSKNSISRVNGAPSGHRRGDHHGSLGSLMPPRAIKDPAFNGHKKSASTASSPSSVYTSEFSTNPSLANSPLFKEGYNFQTIQEQTIESNGSHKNHPSYAPSPSPSSTNNNNIIISANPYVKQLQNFSRTINGPSRSKSVPDIKFNQKNHERKYTEYQQAFTNLEEETLLPAPPTQKDSLTSIVSPSSPMTYPKNDYSSVGDNEVARSQVIARIAESAAANPRESFSTSFSEALSMPAPSPTLTLHSSHSTSSSLLHPLKSPSFKSKASKENATSPRLYPEPVFQLQQDQHDPRPYIPEIDDADPEDESSSVLFPNTSMMSLPPKLRSKSFSSHAFKNPILTGSYPASIASKYGSPYSSAISSTSSSLQSKKSGQKSGRSMSVGGVYNQMSNHGSPTIEQESHSSQKLFHSLRNPFANSSSSSLALLTQANTMNNTFLDSAVDSHKSKSKGHKHHGSYSETGKQYFSSKSTSLTNGHLSGGIRATTSEYNLRSANSNNNERNSSTSSAANNPMDFMTNESGISNYLYYYNNNTYNEVSSSSPSSSTTSSSSNNSKWKWKKPSINIGKKHLNSKM